MIEIVESEGRRLEHVSATVSGGGSYNRDDVVMLVFRRDLTSHPATGK